MTFVHSETNGNTDRCEDCGLIEWVCTWCGAHLHHEEILGHGIDECAEWLEVFKEAAR